LEDLTARRGLVEPREGIGCWVSGLAGRCAAMTAQLVTDALMMVIWRRGKFDIERKK
jgi:hypothetical protein